jgi:hypothetical protein
MFHQISWLVYLISVLFVTSVYYIVVILLYHRNTFAAFFRRSGQQRSTVPVQTPATPSMSVGTPLLVEAPDNEEPRFGAPEPDDPLLTSIGKNDGMSKADQEQMITELTTLIKVTGDSNDTKETFLLLFGLLTQKYQELRDTPVRDNIIRQAVDKAQGKLSFTLSPDELNGSWSDR